MSPICEGFGRKWHFDANLYPPRQLWVYIVFCFKCSRAYTIKPSQWRHDTYDNDILHNDTQQSDKNAKLSIMKLSTMATLYCNAECHLCWVSFMLSVIYAECHLCWVSFMLSVVYSECHLCCVSFMLCVIYTERHLCCVSFMLSVVYAECCLFWVSFMLCVIYAECRLCWVLQISPLCWVSLCLASLCSVSRHFLSGVVS